jgi:hypothetical protein
VGEFRGVLAGLGNFAGGDQFQAYASETPPSMTRWPRSTRKLVRRSG